jgi:integrative and conjugative element protein (TIGR02256 family)
MKIERAPEVDPRLRTALRKAGQREIGGLLMAEQLSPAHFRIVDFSLDALSGAHTRFHRDPLTHQRALDEFFERTGWDFQRFNYLGEWHSHPSFSVLPSVEDIQTMTDIVESGNATITFAVLLIVRLRWQLWIDCSLTVFARGQGPRRLRPSSRRLGRAVAVTAASQTTGDRFPLLPGSCT